MSNKVYGYCDAGCRREVVSVDSYIKSSPLAVLNDLEVSEYGIGMQYSDGKIYKRYKIFAANDGYDNFSEIRISVFLSETDGWREIASVDMSQDKVGRGYIVFEAYSLKDESGNTVIFYVIDNVADSSIVSNIVVDDISKVKFKFLNIDKIYLYDPDAEFKVVPENGITRDEARELIEEVIAEALEGEY